MSLLNEIMWRLRTMRTDEDSRMVASTLLAPHIAACELSDEDTVNLITIVAERLKTGPEEVSRLLFCQCHIDLDYTVADNTPAFLICRTWYPKANRST